MSDHTQGRLEQHNPSNQQIGLYANGYGYVAFVGISGATHWRPLQEANARRLVACWNALLPHKTEDLEREGPLGFRSHARLFEERDELIAALRPLAAERLSTEPFMSDLVYRDQATVLRMQADAIQRKDGEILKARSLIAKKRPA